MKYLPDLGNGQYQNPVLLCDYSDPDVIRVGDTYYLTASTFNYVPGLPILTSKDMVNWTLRNYALTNIPEERYQTPRHAQGVWAPAIRYNDGWFYICYGMPDEGIFMIRTQDPLGEWEKPVCLLEAKGLIDPCPLWDDDGNAYVIHGYARSRSGIKSIIGMFPMSWDGLRVTGEDHFIYNGLITQPTIEGPKMYKHDGWYYIFAPAGGVEQGWQTILRSRSIWGPYEEKNVLSQQDTVVNGPHQGGWVTDPDGKDWFMHFQSRGLYGRIVHLQPMYWADGWPVMGDNGKPVMVHEKPNQLVTEPTGEFTSDDFMGPLGLQWQFMGTWRKDFYDVGDGVLTLHACKIPEPDGTLWRCPQVISQKVAALSFSADTTLDVQNLHAGDRAGMALVGGQYGGIAVVRDEDGAKLCSILSAGDGKGEDCVEVARLTGTKAELRMVLTNTAYAEAEAQFYYRDGGEWIAVGEPFAPAKHTWVGARIALFSMPGGDADGGSAAFGAFVVE